MNRYFSLGELNVFIKSFFARRPNTQVPEEASPTPEGWACPSGGQDDDEDESHSYLLLCLPYMQRAFKVKHSHLCRLRSDRDFFRLLRSSYKATRRSFWSFLSLRELKGIYFVQVRKNFRVHDAGQGGAKGSWRRKTKPLRTLSLC